jgi:hypothetical protein
VGALQSYNLLFGLDRRCEKMVADGLLEEVLRLLAAVGAERMKSIVGYKQAVNFLTTHPNPTVKQFHEFLSTFQQATRAYAKRQLSYYRYHDIAFDCASVLQSLKVVNRTSERFHPTFRCVRTHPTDVEIVGLTDIACEIFNQSPEEYAKGNEDEQTSLAYISTVSFYYTDPRWREQPPVLESKSNRLFVPTMVVFKDPDNVRVVLQRLQNERDRIRRQSKQ